MDLIYSGNNLGAGETARITAGLVHDLNNLLMIIHGHVELLNINNKEYGIKPETLAIMEGALEQGRAISVQLMDLCIRNLNKSLSAKLETSELDINNIVCDVVGMVRTNSHNGVGITVELEPNLQPIHGDALSIQRLLVNLAENAYAAIPASGVITISTANVNLAKAYVLLSVRDTGLGMDESVKNLMFNPTFTTKQNGHGMGMFVVKQVAEDHGGWVEVESAPGTGTEVKVYFPVRSEVRCLDGFAIKTAREA